jgi:hypothetical protein
VLYFMLWLVLVMFLAGTGLLYMAQGGVFRSKLKSATFIMAKFGLSIFLVAVSLVADFGFNCQICLRSVDCVGDCGSQHPGKLTSVIYLRLLDCVGDCGSQHPGKLTSYFLFP